MKLRLDAAVRLYIYARGTQCLVLGHPYLQKLYLEMSPNVVILKVPFLWFLEGKTHERPLFWVPLGQCGCCLLFFLGNRRPSEAIVVANEVCLVE